MFLIRILIIITLVGLAVPLVNRGIDYVKEKYSKAKVIKDTTKKIIRYKD